MKLYVKDEYRALLPKHTPQQLEDLERLILAEGVRDPIVHNPDGVVMDGMTRFEIAEKHGITDYDTLEMSWDNEEHEKAWIRQNQCARRNLTREEEAYQRGQAYNKAVENHIFEEQEAEEETESIAKEMAEERGVSERTVRREGQLAELIDQLPERIKKNHLDGTTKLNKHQMETLLECPNLQQVERALRVGQANDTLDAYKQATGETLSKTKPKKKEETVVEAATEEEREEPEEKSAGERMEECNSAIESFCRRVMKDFRQGLTELKVDNKWIEWNGRDGTAEQGIKSALTTIRSCKGAGECLKCNGEGCKACQWTGWVDKATYDQMR